MTRAATTWAVVTLLYGYCGTEPVVQGDPRIDALAQLLQDTDASVGLVGRVLVATTTTVADDPLRAAAGALESLAVSCERVGLKAWPGIRLEVRPLRVLEAVERRDQSQPGGGGTDVRVPSASVEHVLAVLTPQEQRVMWLVAAGKTNRQVGEAMFLSEKTVKNYLFNLLRKLKMQRRTELAAFAARLPDRHIS